MQLSMHMNQAFMVALTTSLTAKCMTFFKLEKGSIVIKRNVCSGKSPDLSFLTFFAAKGRKFNKCNGSAVILV